MAQKNRNGGGKWGNFPVEKVINREDYDQRTVDDREMRNNGPL
jgi:hypothetical protein